MCTWKTEKKYKGIAEINSIHKGCETWKYLRNSENPSHIVVESDGLGGCKDRLRVCFERASMLWSEIGDFFPSIAKGLIIMLGYIGTIFVLWM